MATSETRRTFLGRWRWWAVAALVLPLARCGSNEGRRDETRRRAARLDRALDCTDTSGLWPAEIETRTSNAYRERSEHDDRYCFNCNNFTEPAPAAACGTCRSVKGPINPGGWCKVWAERA